MTHALQLFLDIVAVLGGVSVGSLFLLLPVGVVLVTAGRMRAEVRKTQDTKHKTD